MPSSAGNMSKHGREPEEQGLEMVLVSTQALFKSRKTLTESCFDTTMRTCKAIARRTMSSEQVRNLLGNAPQQWKDMTEVFTLAIPVLEAQSLAPENAQDGSSISSSTLMAANYDTLMKDLERLNDILLIARNLLATTPKVQNLAGESLLDQQVLKLIDLCVRVTARGYDGDAGSRAELLWGNVIGSYKKLLITCLQFLYNFIQDNEQRKLLLWLDLFANSKVAQDYNAGTLPPGLGRKFAGRVEEIPGKSMEEIVLGSKDSGKPGQSLPSAAEDMDGEPNSEAIEERGRSSDSRNSLRQDIDEITDSVEAMQRMSSSGAGNESTKEDQIEENTQHLANRPAKSAKALTNKASYAATRDDLLFGAVRTDRGDEFGALRTPQSAAITLQAAKDQLMARLADTATGAMNDEEQDLAVFGNDGESGGQGPPMSDEDEGYRSSGEAGDLERGLLTDIPLVLGPQEIEALPMIIQIGICAGQGAILSGRDMQAMRCNILLAGEPGRNLLRELLIFIAAWDLQDDEMYFKLMMQIMEAILENGLMPYAYQTFAEVKDIVSPAQSMVIKILTQIFRGKQGMPTHGTDAFMAGNVHADASRRVDIYIVRYIFTIFRQCIIPETCALIYLQGQIKAKNALPEDFPLNLWDMERVYEGVYQFLEFFAVLTESEEWKDLLVNWEIVSELVTLLRELEASIPKAPMTVPQTVAEAQRQAATQPSPQPSPSTNPTPAPVAIERPFDTTHIPLPAAERPFDTTAPKPTSPLPTTASPSSRPSSASPSPSALDAADPSDFEWRNLKKLVILVLSSLVWKSPTVQNQIRQYGGVEMVMACCMYDGNNPYIKEHAIMCLRFLLEGCEENRELVRGLEGRVGRGASATGSVLGRGGREEGELARLREEVKLQKEGKRKGKEGEGKAKGKDDDENEGEAEPKGNIRTF